MRVERSFEALEEEESWTLISRTESTLGSGERKFSERESMGFRVKRRDSWNIHRQRIKKGRSCSTRRKGKP